MKVHRNAKTTFKMRQLIATRAQEGCTYRQIAAALGLSVRTVAKWVARARQAKLDGSIVAAASPTAATAGAPRVGDRDAATHPGHGLADQRCPGHPRSTVTRVLARVGLNRVALLEPAPLVQRYEWPRVGDLLHLDLKRLGRVTRIGHRIHGDRRRRGRHVGWDICMSRSMMRRV